MLEEKKREDTVTREKAKVGQRREEKRKRRSGNWQKSMGQNMKEFQTELGKCGEQKSGM